MINMYLRGINEDYFYEDQPDKEYGEHHKIYLSEPSFASGKIQTLARNLFEKIQNISQDKPEQTSFKTLIQIFAWKNQQQKHVKLEFNYKLNRQLNRIQLIPLKLRVPRPEDNILSLKHLIYSSQGAHLRQNFSTLNQLLQNYNSVIQQIRESLLKFINFQAQHQFCLRLMQEFIKLFRHHQKCSLAVPAQKLFEAQYIQKYRRLYRYLNGRFLQQSIKITDHREKTISKVQQTSIMEVNLFSYIHNEIDTIVQSFSDLITFIRVNAPIFYLLLQHQHVQNLTGRLQEGVDEYNRIATRLAQNNNLLTLLTSLEVLMNNNLNQQENQLEIESEKVANNYELENLLKKIRYNYNIFLSFVYCQNGLSQLLNIFLNSLNEQPFSLAHTLNNLLIFRANLYLDVPEIPYLSLMKKRLFIMCLDSYFSIILRGLRNQNVHELHNDQANIITLEELYQLFQHFKTIMSPYGQVNWEYNSQMQAKVDAILQKLTAITERPALLNLL